MKKKEILKKQLKKLIEKEGEKTELGNIGEPKKRVKKEDMYVSSLDRLGGEFRDVVRDRSSKLFNIQNSRNSSAVRNDLIMAITIFILKLINGLPDILDRGRHQLLLPLHAKAAVMP